MFNVLAYFFPSFYIQFTNTFYIGRKRIPISLKKNREGYTVKLGSGFASYTLETTKEELVGLSQFINSTLEKNS
jgi:hypothetical protein